MDKFYQTDGVHSYIVLNQIEIPQDSYEVDMVANNNFCELLNFDFRMMDNQQQMYYKIDGLMEIEDFIENDEMESKWVIALLDNLIDIIFKLYDYLLSPNDLILDMDGILYEQRLQRFQFMFLPGYNIDVHMQMKELIEKLLRIMSHKERKGVDFIYGLYELVQQERYDLENVRIYIKSYAERNYEGIENSIKGSDRYIEKNDIAGQEEPISAKLDAEKRSDVMDLLFSPKLETEDTDRNKYWLLLKIIMGFTVLAGIVVILVDLKQYQQIYHIKPLMIVFILIAVEIFVYMEIEKDSLNGGVGTTETTKSAETIKIDEVIENEKEQICQLKNVKNDEIFEAVSTTVLSEYGEATTLLSDEIPKYRLVPDRGNYTSKETASIYGAKQCLIPEYRIDAAAVVIGRDSACSDYCILNETVSRRHAQIYRDRELVLLEDFNSTNGTFVNDIPVLSGHPVIISEGDCIRFGAVSYFMKKESQ